MDMVVEIPDYIFTMRAVHLGVITMPSSAKRMGSYIIFICLISILNHRLRLKGNKEKYSSPEERDAMRCVPAFHDAVKCGWNGSKYTVQDHPLLAARWVLDTKVAHDIPDKYKQMIADMCESHSGEWNKSRSGKVIMSEPRNDREFFIHECDILSSRNDLDYIIPDELLSVLPEEEIPDINYLHNSILANIKEKHFRKSKRLIQDIFHGAKENMTREPVKTLLAQV